MSTHFTAFLKCGHEWSYKFAGCVKDFAPLDQDLLARLYRTACEYIRIRHNFVTGYLDGPSYTDAFYNLLKPFSNDGILEGIIAYNLESLYRMQHCILEGLPEEIEEVNYVHNERGDLTDLVIIFKKRN